MRSHRWSGRVLRNESMFFFEYTPVCSTVSRESYLLLIDYSSLAGEERENPTVNGFLIT